MDAPDRVCVPDQTYSVVALGHGISRSEHPACKYTYEKVQVTVKVEIRCARRRSALQVQFLTCTGCRTLPTCCLTRAVDPPGQTGDPWLSHEASEGCERGGGPACVQVAGGPGYLPSPSLPPCSSSGLCWPLLCPVSCASAQTANRKLTPSLVRRGEALIGSCSRWTLLPQEGVLTKA